MPTKRFENIDPDRRKKILDAARTEFILSGYDGASLNDIIREAEISKGSLYYYFEDKADLYITVLNHVMEKAQQKVGGIAVGEFTDDFWVDIKNFCKSVIEFTLENPDIIRLARGLQSLLLTDSTNESVKEFYEAGKAKTAEILIRGQEIGVVRKDIPLELLTNIVYSVGETMDYWTFDNWETLTQKEIEQIYVIYTEMFRKIAGIDTEKG